MHYFNAFKFLKGRIMFWRCISKFGRGLRHYVSYPSKRFFLPIATTVSSDMQKIFEQVCCEMEIFVLISWNFFFFRAKSCLFLHTVLSKEETQMIGK
jgi:hypothetical protein